ncbi:hypothetical protein [Desertivirga xinjiangensis]|uniref:hypothetical protein n=1 Tax=Desertivirga xinjiangensis TaxID=539206 RepID=UPI002108D183|nr:hypothetical protein [Pedobacter xinjiangensis]
MSLLICNKENGRWYITNEEISRIFDQENQQITGGKITMGIIEVIKKQEREEGKLEGKLEGELEKAIEIAAEMKRDGLPVAQIVKFTKLSAEEIEGL